MVFLPALPSAHLLPSGYWWLLRLVEGLRISYIYLGAIFLPGLQLNEHEVAKRRVFIHRRKRIRSVYPANIVVAAHKRLTLRQLHDLMSFIRRRHINCFAYWVCRYIFHHSTQVKQEMKQLLFACFGISHPPS